MKFYFFLNIWYFFNFFFRLHPIIFIRTLWHVPATFLATNLYFINIVFKDLKDFFDCWSTETKREGMWKIAGHATVLWPTWDKNSWAGTLVTSSVYTHTEIYMYEVVVRVSVCLSLALSHCQKVVLRLWWVCFLDK